MIVPMKKISLVVLDRERREVLKKLRSLGVVHLEPLEGTGSKLEDFRNQYTKLESALVFLQDIAVKDKKGIEIPSLDRTASLQTAERILSYFSEKKSLEDLKQKNLRELDRYKKWGTINLFDFEFLKRKGIMLHLYEIPVVKYSLISEEVHTLEVSRDKRDVRFILISSSAERPENLPVEAFQIAFPEKSTTVLADEVVNAEKRIADINIAITEHTVYISTLKQNLSRLAADVEFENACSGMRGDGTETVNNLRWFTGYVPAVDLEKLKASASAEHWALLADNPSDEDAVPTKLENNRIVKLIDPVMDFLGTVPGYYEYDISGWFLLFFAIFFGMIFGDAGYGSLMVLIATGGIIAAKARNKTVNPALKLLFLLGGTTVIWGTLNCSWFGILPQYLPAGLRNLSLWFFNSENPDSGMNLQIFCFVLALFQLSVAHLKGIVRNIRSPKFLGDLGSMLMLWGMFSVVLNLVVSSERFPLNTITFILIGAGFALNFIFSNYAGNIVSSILESLKNIVSVLLGVVNVFSDIVSYIRLWAVGIAGAAIAQTVNSMAGPALGGLLIFLGILLLFFGHGLNMVLNVLSVIVHGVRLNTLEFTSHLGMSWSGFKYEPFSETVEQ